MAFIAPTREQAGLPSPLLAPLATGLGQGLASLPGAFNTSQPSSAYGSFGPSRVGPGTINVQPIGVNLGAITLPYTDSAYNGGAGYDGGFTAWSAPRNIFGSELFGSTPVGFKVGSDFTIPTFLIVGVGVIGIIYAWRKR